MKIAVAFTGDAASGDPDEQDVLIQAHAVASALTLLGHDTVTLECSLDLDSVKKRLEHIGPGLVFNLVESLEGSGRLIHLFPCLLDAMRLPYTGSCTEAMFMTSHKILAKERLISSGLPTPPWIGPYPQSACATPKPGPDAVAAGTRWIVKSVWEHASVGLDESDLQLCDCPNDALGRFRRDVVRLGGSCFAEAFVEGREINISLLADPAGPRILPPAEILFQDYPQNRPRIVGYRAKWDQDSFEYHHTARRFDFPPEDTRMLDEVSRIALRCWDLFGLCGYARVDFRVDNQGNPWVLEINTNPCLSPDAGFSAALSTAGISFAAAIDRILTHPCGLSLLGHVSHSPHLR